MNKWKVITTGSSLYIIIKSKMHASIVWKMERKPAILMMQRMEIHLEPLEYLAI